MKKRYITSDDAKKADIVNTFFINVVENLNIQGYNVNYSRHKEQDLISYIIKKIKNHPSILKFKEVHINKEKLPLTKSNENDIASEINDLNTSKLTTCKNIPAKHLVLNCDICTPHKCNILTFLENLKMADVNPAHKKDDKTMKENYRPISILPSVLKIFKRILYNQIYAVFDQDSTQYCLLLMLENGKKP